MITSVILAEEETEETTACEECGKQIPSEEEFYFVDPHNRDSGYYCDEHIPYCYGACCGNEWF